MLIAAYCNTSNTTFTLICKVETVSALQQKLSSTDFLPHLCSWDYSQSAPRKINSAFAMAVFADTCQ